MIAVSTPTKSGGKRDFMTPLVAKLDTLHWALYLFILVGVSFINQPYMADQWLKLSTLLYAFSASYCLSLMFGGRCNKAAMYAARYAITLCVLMLCWLFLQTVLPLNNDLFARVYGSSPVLIWFEPEQVWSVVPDKTRGLLLSNLAVFTLFILSICLVDSRLRLRQLLFTIMSVGLLHAVVAILVKYANVHLVELPQLDGHYDAARAWFVNRNHFAAFISLCLVGALSYQLNELMRANTDKFVSVLVDQLMSVRVLLIISVIISLAALILSHSRGGFLALILSVLVIVMSMGKQTNHRLPRRYLLVPGLIAIAVLLGYFGQGLFARFSDGSLALGERALQWQISWQAIKHEFLLGYGAGSYATVFQVYREYADLRQVVYDQAHNDYLHIWLEQGLVGLLMWLIFLALALRMAFVSVTRAPSRLVTALSLVSLVVVLASLIQSGVAYHLQIINIRCYFFVIIAMIYAAPKVRHRKIQHGKRKLSSTLDRSSAM